MEEVYIADGSQCAFVLTDDVRLAYTLGLHFKEDNPDLAAWRVYCRPASEQLAGKDLYRQEQFEGVGTLAQVIRKGLGCNHSCPRHPEVKVEG